MLQSLQFGNLLLERRAHASLLAGCLVERRQLRQVAGMTRVDLCDALAGLVQCPLGVANLGLDRGKMLLDRRQRRCEAVSSYRRRVSAFADCSSARRAANTLCASFRSCSRVCSSVFQVPIRGVQFRDLALIQLLLSGKSDEIRRRFTIGWRKRAQPGTNVAEFFDLLGQVLDRPLRGSDAIRIRLQRACALGQRQLDGPHLLAAKFVQQIPAFVTEDFVRDRLDLEAAVGVQGQKRASIEIDRIDRPPVRCEKHRVSA